MLKLSTSCVVLAFIHLNQYFIFFLYFFLFVCIFVKNLFDIFSITVDFLFLFFQKVLSLLRKVEDLRRLELQWETNSLDKLGEVFTDGLTSGPVTHSVTEEGARESLVPVCAAAGRAREKNEKLTHHLKKII